MRPTPPASSVRLLVALFLTSFLSLGILFSFATPASAAPGSADLSLSTDGFGYKGLGGRLRVCNDGDETIQQFVVDQASGTAQVKEFFLSPADSHPAPTDLGSINLSGQWNGLLEDTQCLWITVILQPNVEFGETFDITFTLTDSILEGGTPNVDPDSSNDTIGSGIQTYTDLPDVSINTRLLTTGPITTGSTVTYEATVSITATSSYDPIDDYLSLAFLIPSSATYSSVTDANLTDGFDILMCGAPAAPGTFGSGLVGYSGNLVHCLILPTNVIPVGTSTYSFNFEMEATSDFVSGAFSVYAFAVGIDLDSLSFMTILMRGEDPLALDTNNRTSLEYDNSQLQATINRCPGQGATTTNGTGCFRVTFNKLIWVPSFDVNDLIVNGSGSITGFIQLDDYTWEVHVSGIALNTTLEINLQDGSVQDWNAVQNSVSVLGENTIRYELPTDDSSHNNGTSGTTQSTTATGTLAETGGLSDFLTPIYMMLIGILLCCFSRLRKPKHVS